MKITSIDVIAIQPGCGMNLVYAKVNTDEGIYGLGETGVAIGVGGIGAVEIIKGIAPMIIGMDPLENDVIWEKMYKNTFWGVGNGAFISSAISAIDTALWDIKGKYFNASVATLLGGKHRDQLRCYASQLQMGWKEKEHCACESPEELRDAALKAMADGYDAIKANILGLGENKQRRHHLETTGYLSRSVMRRAEERLAALRDAVGSDVDIIMENHAITDANTAIQFASMACEYDIMYLEEPAPPLNIEVFKHIAEYSPIPLATGERTYLRQGFRPLIESQAVALLQPDLGSCGGITEAKKIADMAYVYDIPVQCHVCSGPMSVAAAIQFEAAIPNFVIHEVHPTNTLKLITELGTNDYQPVNGYITVPDLPGFGMDLSEKAMSMAQIVTVK